MYHGKKQRAWRRKNQKQEVVHEKKNHKSIQTKKYCDRHHTKVRFQERFGFWISNKDYEKMVELASIAPISCDQGTKAVKVIHHRGCYIPVVVQKKTGRIVTILPEECVEERIKE